MLPAVGYDSPDQSHFVSRHFWEVGALDAQLRSGWLGRLLDRVGTPDNPLQGISLGGSLGPSLAAARVPVAAVDAPEDFGFWAPGAWGPPGELAIPAFADVGRALAGSRDPAVAQAARAAAFAGQVSASLAPLGNDGEPTYTPLATYPGGESRFPRRLAGLAAMLAAGLPIRCATLSAPGAWDTHADQADTLTENLTITADSLYAFQRDLEARGIADRVLTLVWSEFGRRAAENGSGTDHGAAGIGFVIGTRASGRMIGEFPGLGPARRVGEPARDVGLPRAVLVAGRRLVRRRPGRRARRWRRARGAAAGGAMKRRCSSLRCRRSRAPRRPRPRRRRGCWSSRASSTSCCRGRA